MTIDGMPDQVRAAFAEWNGVGPPELRAAIRSLEHTSGALRALQSALLGPEDDVGSTMTDDDPWYAAAQRDWEEDE